MALHAHEGIVSLVACVTRAKDPSHPCRKLGGPSPATLLLSRVSSLSRPDTPCPGHPSKSLPSSSQDINLIPCCWHPEAPRPVSFFSEDSWGPVSGPRGPEEDPPELKGCHCGAGRPAPGQARDKLTVAHAPNRSELDLRTACLPPPQEPGGWVHVAGSQCFEWS